MFVANVLLKVSLKVILLLSYTILPLQKFLLCLIRTSESRDWNEQHCAVLCGSAPLDRSQYSCFYVYLAGHRSKSHILFFQAEDLIERTRELQLLRVNKSVHQVVKQGEAGLHSQKASGYEQLIKFNEKLHKNKIAERQKRLAKLESMIMEKAMQNEQMNAEIERVGSMHEGHRRIQHSLSSTKAPSKRYGLINLAVSIFL